MNQWLKEFVLQARVGRFAKAKERLFFLPLLVLLVGCDQLRVQNLPNSKLSCDPNLVGVWRFDEDGNKSFVFLNEDCSELFSLDMDDSGREAQSVELLGTEIRSFTLNGQNFLVSARDPERDTANLFEDGYYLVRYQVQSDELSLAPGDVYSAAKDIDANTVPGMVQHNKNSDGSSMIALLTGNSKEITQVLKKQNYYAKFSEPSLRRANAMDAALVMKLVTEFQTTQRSKK